MKRHRIANLMDIHHKMHGRNTRPNEHTQEAVIDGVIEAGITFDSNGRLMPKKKFFNGREIGTPKGMRWQNGKLIPRHGVHS